MMIRPLRSVFICHTIPAALMPVLFLAFGGMLCFGLWPVSFAIASDPDANVHFFYAQGNGFTLDPAASGANYVPAPAPGRGNQPGQMPVQYGSWSIYHRDSLCSVTIYYPQLNNLIVDSELNFWANKRLRSFLSGISLLSDPAPARFILQIDYTLSQPSNRFVSIIFRISSDTGGSYQDEGLATFTYDLSRGRLLGYEDIFDSADGLLNFLSSYCYDELVSRLGTAEEALIRRGTAPNIMNYDFFALTPYGLRVFFPPYQVASLSRGEQQVNIPLELLAPYQPKAEVWDTAGNSFAIGGKIK